MSDTLTPKQEAFAQAVVVKGSQRAALNEIYPRSKTWSEARQRSRAAELTATRKIARRIAALREELRERNNIEVDDVVRRLAGVVFDDPMTVFEPGPGGRPTLKPLNEWTDAERRMVKEIHVDEAKKVVKVKFHDMLTALEKLGRHLGIYERDNKQRSEGFAALLDAIAGESMGLPGEIGNELGRGQGK